MRGQRALPIGAFVVGYRTTALQPGQLVTAIRMPKIVAPARAVFAKLSNRKDQAISVVHAAIALSFDGEVVSADRLALGSVAATVVRADRAEAMLIGRALTAETIAAAARTASAAV